MTGQNHVVGTVLGTSIDGQILLMRVAPEEGERAPAIGDLVIVETQSKARCWMARVEAGRHTTPSKDEPLIMEFDLVALAEREGDQGWLRVPRHLPPPGSLVRKANVGDLQCFLTTDPEALPIGYYAVGSVVDERLPVAIVPRRFLRRRTGLFGHDYADLLKSLVASIVLAAGSPGLLVLDRSGALTFGDDDAPGLAAIPALAASMSVYTRRRPANETEAAIVAGKPAIDLTSVRAWQIANALHPSLDRPLADRLRGLTAQEWQALVRRLVDHAPAMVSEPDQPLFSGSRREPEIPFQGLIGLHDPTSMLLQEVGAQVAHGRVVVVDLSDLRAEAAHALSSLLIETLLTDPPTREALVVVDHAHELLTSDHCLNEAPLARLFGPRRHRLGLLYATPSPSKLASQVLDATEDALVLHLPRTEDINALLPVHQQLSPGLGRAIKMEPLPGRVHLVPHVPEEGVPIMVAAHLIPFEEMVRASRQESVFATQLARRIAA